MFKQVTDPDGTIMGDDDDAADEEHVGNVKK